MYTLTPRRRPAAARVERDWRDIALGCVLYALLVIGACWSVP